MSNLRLDAMIQKHVNSVEAGGLVSGTWRFVEVQGGGQPTSPTPCRLQLIIFTCSQLTQQPYCLQSRMMENDLLDVSW
jgi:hypothetical protein